MKFFFAALIGLTAVFAVNAQHHTRPGNPPNWNNQHNYRPHHVRPVTTGKRVVINNYHLTHGVKFKFGFYYQGYGHNHWSYHYWDTRYGAYLYFDSYVNQYFYWCAPHFRFYPITYVPLGTFAFPYVKVPMPPTVPVPAPPPVELMPPAN